MTSWTTLAWGGVGTVAGIVGLVLLASAGWRIPTGLLFLWAANLILQAVKAVRDTEHRR